MNLPQNEENNYVMVESLNQSFEFDEWVRNGLDKAEKIIKDTAEK